MLKGKGTLVNGLSVQKDAQESKFESKFVIESKIESKIESGIESEFRFNWKNWSKRKASFVEVRDINSGCEIAEDVRCGTECRQRCGKLLKKAVLEAEKGCSGNEDFLLKCSL